MLKRIALWGVVGGLVLASLGALFYEPDPHTPEAGLYQRVGH